MGHQHNRSALTVAYVKNNVTIFDDHMCCELFKHAAQVALKCEMRVFAEICEGHASCVEYVIYALNVSGVIPKLRLESPV